MLVEIFIGVQVADNNVPEVHVIRVRCMEFVLMGGQEMVLVFATPTQQLDIGVATSAVSAQHLTTEVCANSNAPKQIISLAVGMELVLKEFGEMGLVCAIKMILTVSGEELHVKNVRQVTMDLCALTFALEPKGTFFVLGMARALVVFLETVPAFVIQVGELLTAVLDVLKLFQVFSATATGCVKKENAFVIKVITTDIGMASLADYALKDTTERAAFQFVRKITMELFVEAMENAVMEKKDQESACVLKGTQVLLVH